MTLKPPKKFIQQDIQFEKLRDEQTPVTLLLTGGLKLHGRIESFDQYVITLVNEVPQMVFKHAIALVQPQRQNAKARPSPPIDHPARKIDRPAYREEPDGRAPVMADASSVAKAPVVVRKKTRTIVRP